MTQEQISQETEEAATSEDKAKTRETEPAGPWVLGEAYELCIAPISVDAPYGENPRHDSAFLDLKSEIENVASGRVDWKKVRELALAILTTKAKDLNTACYLTAALIQVENFPGLADGLKILHRLIEDHWEGVHPKHPRARSFALEWLVTRVHPYIEAQEAREAEAECLRNALADLLAIVESASERLEHLAPSFDDLSSALRGKVGELAPPKTEPNPDDKAPIEPSRDTVPDPEPGPRPPKVELPPSKPLTDNASDNEIRERFRVLIAPLRRHNLFSPMSYRMLRILKWDDLPGQPPNATIPPPRAPQKAALEGLFSSERWPQLLEASEAAFQDGPGTFWLDLQLYSSTALERIDSGQGSRTARMIRDELAKLLERFRNLPQMTFKDGSPFASPEARNWIDAAVKPMAIEVGATTAGSDEAVLTAEEIEEARDLFSRQEPAEALAILQDALARATHRRGRFRARLTAAQLCLKANHLEWAKVVLEELAREMDDFRFEHWEPETAVEIYQLLTLCFGRLLRQADSGDAQTEAEQARWRQRQAELRAKLFRLDLRAASKTDQMLEDG